MKKWEVKEWDVGELPVDLKGFHPLIAQLLYNRGLKSQFAIDLFFEPGYEKVHDPFLFKPMEKVVKRLWQAIEKKEKILVHGDYDADGVTSSALMFRALKMLDADVDVFIPHREDDGYGLNPDNLNKFVEGGVKVLVTVDCGITNVNEVKALQDAGVDVIVTDHHDVPEKLPEAFAILNPKVKDIGYPFPGLCGAGVAFKLIQALMRDEAKMKKFEAKLQPYGGVFGYEKWLLDIVAIATVADMAPLIDENRIFVKWGLIVLQQTRHAGLQKLLEIIKPRQIDSFTIGFQIGPRINAAGRINHASMAWDMLVTDDPVEGERLAWELQSINKDRQKIIEKAMEQAREQIGDVENKRSLFFFDEEWKPGVVGLIAGRMAEEFYRPVFAMTTSNDSVVGSGRSVAGFNITDSLHQVSELLARYGGHEAACGFTLSGVDVRQNFEKKLNAYIEEALKGVKLEPTLGIERKVNISELDFEMLEQLEKFAPYGEGNSKPLFLLEDVEITAIDKIGKESTHLRLLVKQDTPILYKMLWFGKAKEWADVLKVGEKVDVVCEMGINRWNGSKEFEFKVVDMKQQKA
jgi:single-stranded-DNA-specific exonuclease